MNLKTTPTIGWIFIIAGAASSILRNLGKDDIAQAIDGVLGHLSPFLIGTGAAALHVARSPLEK